MRVEKYRLIDEVNHNYVDTSHRAVVTFDSLPLVEKRCRKRDSFIYNIIYNMTIFSY